jgi:hypothetical protein
LKEYEWFFIKLFWWWLQRKIAKVKKRKGS